MCIRDSFKVTEIKPSTVSPETLLEYAVYAESFSNHPISKSLLEAYGRAIDWTRIGDSEEIAGHGVRAVIDGQEVLAGNAKLMQKANIPYETKPLIGTVVQMCIRDSPRPGSRLPCSFAASAAFGLACRASASISWSKALSGDFWSIPAFTPLVPGSGRGFTSARQTG